MPQLKKINILFLFAVIALFFSMSSCEESIAKEKSLETVGAVQFDIDSIIKRGSLILLTENSASTYYLYKNQIRGFDFEMVRLFAKSIGVKLEVKLLDDVDKMFDMLNKGEGDIIATNLTVTAARKQIVSFTKPVYQTRQVLAQRKIFAHADSATILVRDSTELSKLPIWVHHYSSFYERLKEIELQYGKALNIQEAPGEISTDDLLRLINEGAIPATITDENLVAMEQIDFEMLDMTVPITGEQDIAWATRKTSPQLLEAINAWLISKKTNEKLLATYNKYFSSTTSSTYATNYVMPKMSPGAISPYDSLFKIHAPSLNWDWRMLAAIAFQESRFNPSAQSWSGAFGLMQLMPETAMRFGCDVEPPPDCSVAASAKYLKYLQTMWKKRVPDLAERDKFVLASYNIGQGHVLDAQNLAKELGMADTIWDGNVAEALLLKQQEKYYSMSCVKHGYCHAKEPYHFVGKILALYAHFKSGSSSMESSASRTVSQEKNE